MTIDEIREWYEANKTHTMYEGHWCRTCSIGALLDALLNASKGPLCDQSVIVAK